MTFSRIIFFLFLFAANNITAQDAAIKATVDKNRILIGEPFQLTIEMKFHPTAPILFVQIDSIEHFELAGKPVIDTSNYNDGTFIKGVYTLTSFDSGHWVISSFMPVPGIKSDTIGVDVVFSSFNPEQEYHDIKDIIEVKAKDKNKWWWYAAGGGLLLLLALIYLLTWKKKPTPPVADPVINAYDEAIQKLKQLQQENLTGKEFYTQLVNIFRLYVFRKKKILSLQKTTDDLVIQLRTIVKEPELFKQMQQSLRLSDYVKFAKYNSGTDEDQQSLLIIKKTISQIEETS